MSVVASPNSKSAHKSRRESVANASQRVRLGDVLARHNEIIHPGDRASGEAIFVGLEHIEAGSGRRIGSSTVDFARMTGRKPTFRRGQIVYGYLRPYLNKVWVADFDGCSSVDQFAFEVNPKLARADYIAAFMRSETFLRRSAIVTTTGQLPRIGVEEIAAVEIDLPPLAEQKRIAEWLTAGMAEIEQAHQAAQARLAAAESLQSAYLRQAFDGGKWPVVELASGLERIEAGTSVLSLERPAQESEWGVLKVSAVSWGRFKADENKAVPLSYVPKPHEQVRAGDLLISRANTAELAGAIVLVREQPERLMLSDKTLRLILKPDVFVPQFVELAIRAASARKFIEANATGTSYSMRNISQVTIRAIPLPRPTIEEQRRISAEFERQLTAAQGVIAACRDELDLIEALPTSNLRQAFGTREGYDGEGA